MKQKIYIVISISLLCALNMRLLYSSALEAQILRSPFVRSYKQRVILKRIADITQGAYFAGLHSEIIYLGSTRPYQILSYNSNNLKELETKNLTIQSTDKVISSKIIVNRDFTYLHDLERSIIYRGKYEQKLRPLSNLSFFNTEMVPLNQNTLVIRTFKENERELTIAKLSVDPPLIERAPHLLEKQVDGIFCTDGKLHFSKTLNSFLYVYLYRNEFIQFDTALHIEYRSHTIDTFKHTNLQVVRNPSKRASVVSGLPPFINHHSYVDGAILYINSDVAGSNEEVSRFLNGSVIDAYDLITNSYTYSFYIPEYKGIPLEDFVIDNELVFVIYKNFLVAYTLVSN